MAIKINRSFKVDLLIILIPIFLITFLTIRFYSHYQYTQDVLNISHSFPVLANQSAINEVNNYLKPAGVTKITAELLEQNKTLNIKSPDLLNELHSMLDTYPQLSSIYVLDANGDLTSETRISTTDTGLNYLPNPPANTALAIQTLDSKKASVAWSYFDANNNLISTEHVGEQTDPRNNPWYQGAISNQNYWMGMYTSFNNKVGITISYPIINNGKVLGAVAVDFNADAIADFLATLQQNLNSTLFIVNDQGTLIKASNPDNSTGSDNLIAAALAAQKLNKTYPNIFKVNGIPYIIDMKNFTTDYGSSYNIGTIIPFQSLVTQINKTDQTILYFSLCMLIILIALVLILVHHLAKALKQLGKESLKLKQLDFDQVAWPKTSISEVNAVVAALNNTKNALAVITKYLPRTLVKKLMNTEISSKITGERQFLSLMASTITNFKSISEHSNPEAVAKHLSFYFNRLTHSIVETQGNVDHYLNDTLMAFWGAPTPDENHLIHAGIAALLCCQQIEDLNEEWSALGKPSFKTNFGLHCGNVIVGNVGSFDHISYTLLGENVNSVMSLPALNERYNTRIITSHAFYKETQNAFLYRPVDLIDTPGQPQLIRIYELVAALTDKAPIDLQATSEQIKLCELTRQALNAFEHESWDLAQQLYQEILDQYPNDKVAQLFIERCQFTGQKILKPNYITFANKPPKINDSPRFVINKNSKYS